MEPSTGAAPEGGGGGGASDDGLGAADEAEKPKMERAAPTPTMHRRVGGEVKIGDAKVSGLGAGAVGQALDGKVGDLRRCYEKELLASPSLAGSADVKISVDKTGEVSASASGVGNAALEACVVETVEKVDFGRPQGRAQVTVRITFAPAE
jgi:hypothetical protein